eukprot:359097-Chlamydomonas_euryale.AAC.5
MPRCATASIPFVSCPPPFPLFPQPPQPCRTSRAGVRARGAHASEHRERLHDRGSRVWAERAPFERLHAGRGPAVRGVWSVACGVSDAAVGV